MFHVHIFLAAPLRAGHMTKPGTSQHQGRVSIGEGSDDTISAANLPIELLNDIVGSDAVAASARRGTPCKTEFPQYCS